MMAKTIKLAFGAAAIAGTVALGANPARAVNFSFTGAFTGDADTQGFNFTADGTSNVTLRSYSYAGGTNAAGAVIPAGGFDPILSLFDGAGNRLRTVDDGPNPVPSDPVTRDGFDTNFSQVLTAGNYSVFVSQYDNFAVGPTLADGFSRTAANFTAAFGCSNGQFCDVSGNPAGNNRTANWAFDVLNVASATQVPPGGQGVPEPFTIVGTLVGGTAALRMRKKLRSTIEA